MAINWEILYATQKLMDCLVKKELPIPKEGTHSQIEELTYIEENVLDISQKQIVKVSLQSNETLHSWIG